LCANDNQNLVTSRCPNAPPGARALSGFTVNPTPESGDKLTRFGPFSSQCRAGNLKVRRDRAHAPAQLATHLLEQDTDSTTATFSIARRRQSVEARRRLAEVGRCAGTPADIAAASPVIIFSVP
jgi:hypothetical protein